MEPSKSPATYETFTPHGGVPVKSWTVGVPFDEKAKDQLARVATLPFVHQWVAVMPDVHHGVGATVGSVIATRGAVVPAAVGVDIGCGMMATRTTLRAQDLPDDLKALRLAIEAAVPHGRAGWSALPTATSRSWKSLEPGYLKIVDKYPNLDRGPHAAQLGTLGGGNHFVELCLDEGDRLWIMLHSGSRGVGNRIGTHFIGLAKSDLRRAEVHLPDADLAYFSEGSEHFDDYVEAVSWAQEYARLNRELMMQQVLRALAATQLLPSFSAREKAVNCHHNYVAREQHYGANVLVTRKGAVRARRGDLGIIPGSMGARSFIVRGLGNPESFDSCSHGAGRLMSRTAARRLFSLDDHVSATAGVECRKDEDVIDETPGAYKSIEDVMAAQRDLVEVVHTLKQVVCVKG
jgi:tRNA-splicing ligase RtcB (3'-phosphate/5'-hydroxy nucleic acid ligase)